MPEPKPKAGGTCHHQHPNKMYHIFGKKARSRGDFNRKEENG